ncbi:integrase, catalytic region, zinc finger, CCHC-type containing protein [Tanacetum coccineum]
MVMASSSVSLNFGAINHLARHGLVHGLPRLKFENDHLCSACSIGKSKKQSHKPKSEDTNQEKLYLLHMDLYGPMRVASVNGKKYILVIVDDYSRFTWVKTSSKTSPSALFVPHRGMNVNLCFNQCLIVLSPTAALSLHNNILKYLINSVSIPTTVHSDAPISEHVHAAVVYDLLSSFLLSQGFLKGTVDPTLFISRKGKDILLSPRGIFLNQSKYALESLKKYGMESCDPVDTPMVEKSKLDEDTKGQRTMVSKGSAIALKLLQIYHFIKVQVENGVVELYFVRTDYRLADIFTKALCQERIEFLIDKLGMRSFTPETLKELADEAEE